MTDCFQAAEIRHRATYAAIERLNEQKVGYLIVTKSPLVADDRYIAIMDRSLAHIQISVTSTDAEMPECTNEPHFRHCVFVPLKNYTEKGSM